MIDSLQLGISVMVSFFSTISPIDVRNIYLENHNESQRESFTISASAKMNPHEMWQNLDPGKLIYLNIFGKWLMYSCIVLFIFFSCLQCFVLVSSHRSAVGTLYSEANWLAEVTERCTYFYVITKIALRKAIMHNILEPYMVRMFSVQTYLVTGTA